MIKAFLRLKQKIESNRNSKNIFLESLIKIKDFFWESYIVFIYKIVYPIYLAIKLRGKGKLPDFLIIGVMKGGTSSLWEHLRQHPNIEMSPNFIENKKGWINQKEIHFFDKEEKWRMGKRWYKKFFNKNKKLQGEVTPNYILDPITHKRMKMIVPNAKLILILRDPITRAYSEFNHIRQVFPKSRYWAYLPQASFQENINKEIKKNFEQGIIKKGFYITQIQDLLRYYSKNQLLILISEEMKKNMQENYNKICDFLKIKRFKFKFKQDIHKRKYQEPLKKQEKEVLKKIYRPYNQRLFKFLGYEIKEWKSNSK